MPELLQRITPMKVMQVSEGLKIEPNHVYVIPPSKSMSVLNGTLHLFDPIELRGLRLPIDIFFRSLAADMQEKSIGVILSGMGADGSIGVKAIKEKNGIVLVQDPVNAKFDGMPRSAIDAVKVDIVAPAGDLPAKLIDFLSFNKQVKVEDTELGNLAKNSLDKIIVLLRDQSGHDFSMYKKNTVLRRIERRKNIHLIDKTENYVRFLQENPKEVEILFKELLIGVTSFFRDEAVWEYLRKNVLPAMINDLPDGYILRAWITGCSTGEEAYSLAIVFKEALENAKVHKRMTMQIFATDLDHDSVEIARKGIFSSNIVTDVSPERISRFFTLEAEGYRVNSLIRDMVIFAPQNVIKDPPFTRLDILSCRNMLIYMEPVLQKKLIALFHYSLNPGAIMLLGTAETLGNHKEGFDEVDGKLKIFKRSLTTLTQELHDFPSSFYYPKTTVQEIKSTPKSIENIQILADQILLQRFAPSSVLVNAKGDIQYITGRTGKYLEPAAGKANWNIHVMAREGLRQVLPGAFRKAFQSYEPVIERNIKTGSNGGTQYVDVTVQRIEYPESIRGMVMIVFTDVQVPIDDDSLKSKKGKFSASTRQKELEIEIQRSYQDTRSLREEMQTSQEELKSTNEELQSTNEELQSTNEELSTSKEEMQSMNEELQTVNVELQSKVSDYAQASDDMKNLLNSTEIATLFLDKDLNIRRFTDQVIKVFKLRIADIGRPFTDLVTDLDYPDIKENAQKVLRTLSFIESSVPTHDGRWYNVRIMPYRTLEDRIDGLVITFSDITIAKNLEIELKKANEALRRKKESE